MSRHERRTYAHPARLRAVDRDVPEMGEMMAETGEYWVNVYKVGDDMAYFGAKWDTRRSAITTQGVGVLKAAYRIHVMPKPAQD
jgi:hypothetical protein